MATLVRRLGGRDVISHDRVGGSHRTVSFLTKEVGSLSSVDFLLCARGEFDDPGVSIDLFAEEPFPLMVERALIDLGFASTGTSRPPG